MAGKHQSRKESGPEESELILTRDIKPGGVKVVPPTPELMAQISKRDPVSRGTQMRLLEVAEIIRNEPAISANSLSYMANVLVRVTLPHRAQKGINEFSRYAPGTSLTIMAPQRIGLPYGSIPRVVLSWITTEAVRTKSPELELGSSFTDFMRKLGYTSDSGGDRGMGTRVRDQLIRLFSSTVSVTRQEDAASMGATMQIASKRLLWWDPRNVNQTALFKSTVTLGQEFFAEIIDSPIPVDLRALRALSGSSLALDCYAFCVHRAYSIKAPLYIPWPSLMMQFGTGFSNTPEGLRQFRFYFRQALQKVCMVYPELKVDPSSPDHLLLKPSKPHVPAEPLAKALSRR